MEDMTSRLRADEDFSRERFEQGDALTECVYSWMWNAPTSEEEILRQLDRMEKAGIRALYVIPEPGDFRDYTRRVHLEPEYLSEAFFDRLHFMAENALSRGMTLWLYDEGGWPSGSSCGLVRRENPALCRKSLARREITLHKGDIYRPGERALSAFENGRMVAPGDTAEKDTVIGEYYVEWQPGLVIDPLDEELAPAFIRSTHEKYGQYFADLLGQKDETGRYVPASGRCQLMFTDEPSAGRFPWPRGFEKTFADRFGYDIRPFLPALYDLDAEADEAGTKARMDYRLLTGELFLQNYFTPIRAWCRAHNTLSGGHLDVDHLTDGCLYHSYGSVLPILREMDVPGVDVIWRQITLPRDGQPPCGEGNGFFPRFASSAASQGGGKYALSESLAVYGAQVEGDETAYVIRFQLVRGINLFNLMSASFGRDGAVPTIARPNFSPEMPGYEHLGEMNRYIQRTSYLMQLGMPGEDTALYFPARDIWAGGSARREAIAAFEAAGQRMERAQVDFDVIDDEGIRKARIENGHLCLGLARYRHVIAAPCRYMPADVAEKLRDVDAGEVSALPCHCDAIRVRRRVLPGGRALWMLFNESGEDVTVSPDFGQRDLWRLDADRALCRRAENGAPIALAPGGAEFYLAGGNAPCREEADSQPGRRQVVDGFTLRMSRKATVDGRGLREEFVDQEPFACELGPWDKYFGPEFSGEAVYTAHVTIGTGAGEGEMTLDLGRVECSARVYVDGQLAGVAWKTPKRVVIPRQLTQGKRELDLRIEVANTLANQFAAADIHALFPPDEVGFYQTRLVEFEREHFVGGLYGPVVLEEAGERTI